MLPQKLYHVFHFIILHLMGCNQSKLYPDPESAGRLRVCTQHSDSSQRTTDSVSSQVLVARAVLLGDASVGKSSLSTRYFNDDFKDFHDVTFGGVFFKKEIKYSKDVKVSLQAWDTGGQQKYRSMAPLYYRNASIIFLVCSCTDPDPTASLEYWLNELSEKAQKDNLTILVLINKTDLPKNDEAQSILKWCNSHSIQYFQCSAKTGKGVQQAFKRGLELHMGKIPN